MEAMRNRSLWKLVLLFVLLNVGIIVWGLTHRRPADLRVTFLDVGQGDSCVIEVTVCGEVLARCSAPKLAGANEEGGHSLRSIQKLRSRQIPQ
jgi:hypothetical protein